MEAREILGAGGRRGHLGSFSLDLRECSKCDYVRRSSDLSAYVHVVSRSYCATVSGAPAALSLPWANVVLHGLARWRERASLLAAYAPGYGAPLYPRPQGHHRHQLQDHLGKGAPGSGGSVPAPDQDYLRIVSAFQSNLDLLYELRLQCSASCCCDRTVHIPIFLEIFANPELLERSRRHDQKQGLRRLSDSDHEAHPSSSTSHHPSFRSLNHLRDE